MPVVKILSVGAEGTQVLDIKSALKTHGFLNPRAEEEGDFFGPSTARAILAFQEDRGLTPTGVADRSTLELLL